MKHVTFLLHCFSHRFTFHKRYGAEGLVRKLVRDLTGVRLLGSLNVGKGEAM